MRIGTVERETAERLLRDQAAQGRLDADELSERLATVRSAHTRSDLQPAFRGLPVDVPAAEPVDTFAPYPGTDPYGTSADPYGTGNDPYGAAAGPYGTAAPTTGAQAVPTVSGPVDTGRPGFAPRRFGMGLIPLLWIAAVGVNIVFHWQAWWLFVVVAAVLVILPRLRRDGC